MLTSSSFFHIENRLGHFSSLSVPCLPSPQKNHILKRFKNIMVKESRRAKVRGKNWGVCVCFLEVCWFCLLTVSIFEALNQIWSHCFGVFFWHQTHISSRGILQQPKLFVVDETFFVSKILTGCCLMPHCTNYGVQKNIHFRNRKWSRGKINNKQNGCFVY